MRFIFPIEFRRTLPDMGEKRFADEVVQVMARKFRILTLGGVAVISHGLSRNTHDLDVWCEPLESARNWTSELRSILTSFSGLELLEIGSFRPISFDELPAVIMQDGVIRTVGLDRPLDIFRRPNEMEVGEFEAVWRRATPLDDGTRLPDVVDLLVTKQDTGRAKDTYDIQFLEGKAEALYAERLPQALPDEAIEMLARFLNPKVAEIAARHSHPRVRETGIGFLRELSAEGDPFARDHLAALEKASKLP